MKLSDRNITHKHIFYSPQIANKKILNSNSSKLFNIEKIKFNIGNSSNEEEKNHKRYTSFHSNDEEINSISHRGFDNEIYERLSKENVDFIKTLLRLKQKMYYQNSKFSNYENDKKKYNEKKGNLKIQSKKLLDITPLEITNIQSINHKRDKPIKIKTSLRKLNHSENNTNKRKNIFNNKIDNNYTKNSSINLEKKNNKLLLQKKSIKQRTISAITNKNFRIEELCKEKKVTKKTISPPSKKLIRVNTTGKINNRNPNKNILKKLKEKNNNPVPIAVINLFDNNESNFKIKTGDNKFSFGHKRFKTNY